MKPHARRVLTVFEDPPREACVLRFAPGKRVTGGADEDYVCGNCATVLGEGVTPSMFGPNLFLECWWCHKANLLQAADGIAERKRISPEKELAVARLVAQGLWAEERERDPRCSMAIRVCVIANVNTRMGVTAALHLMVGRGDALAESQRVVIEQIGENSDPLFGFNIPWLTLIGVLDEIGVRAEEFAAERDWVALSEDPDELRVTLLSSMVRTLAVHSGPTGQVDAEVLRFSMARTPASKLH